MKPVCPIITPQYRTLVREAHAYLSAHQDDFIDRFQVATYRRWDWNLGRRTMVFSNDGVPGVIANMHFVGSISTRTNTWLWSWANRSIAPRVSERIREVRRYGMSHGIPQLTEPYWSADEVDGWEMTSISALLLKAEGAYRTPDEHGFAFMVLSDVRRVIEAPVADDPDRGDASPRSPRS